jgi:Fe-S oxidoreductase
MRLYLDEAERRGVWLVRESGLGAAAFMPGQADTWEGWEDSAVAPEKVGPYLRDLRRLYEKYGYIGAFYGHFGQGCIHTRITFDLTSTPGIAQFRSFLEEATDLVVRYGGSLSGEHGDGQSRAEFLYKMFGPELVSAFREFKTIWDPDGKMNPGKIVDPYTVTENLRLGANYAPWDPLTHFKFPEDHGSFAHAVLRCVGVGKCRRPEGDTAQDNVMCPSFMVTREERHSTRGRAHHLWEMLHGGVIQDGWESQAVRESLDLCLSCKGCKGECPVNVDMATYKAEFLSHYYEGRLRPWQAYAFGCIDIWSHLASHAPGFFNLFTQLPGPSHLAKLVAGIPQAREIPPLAPETFQSWWKKRKTCGPHNQHGPRVLLWPDTFNNYYLPQTAQAAVAVLEDAGYQVVVPEGHLCCGRPLYDYGFLGMARTYLQRVLAALQPHIVAGTPMVVLEPSCCSVFRDELHGMMPDSAAAQHLMENTFTFSEFLSRKAADYSPPPLPRDALVQGHCHHKAIMRFDDEEAIMKRMKLNYRLLNSGCCGMAGSFGYEAGEKYEVSVACGERALLPAVRNAAPSTLIVADGFSCRGQIAQGTNREALHLAEVMEMAAREGPFGSAPIYPERKMVEQRRRALRASMVRAGLVTLAALGGLVAAFFWRRKT